MLWPFTVLAPQTGMDGCPERWVIIPLSRLQVWTEMLSFIAHEHKSTLWLYSSCTTQICKRSPSGRSNQLFSSGFSVTVHIRN